MLTQAKVFGTYIVKCEHALESGGLKDIHNSNLEFSDKTVPASSLVWPMSTLTEYRKGIARTTFHALNPDFNYIYRIDKPLRILERTHAEMLWALQKGWVDTEALAKDFPGKSPEEAIKEIDFDDQWGSAIPHLKYLKSGPILNYFDGVQLKDKPNGYWGFISVWLDVVKVAAELVDGNVPRFVKEAPKGTPDIPDEIVDELVAYTAKAGGRIGTAAKKWLQENIKPPYSSIKVYRGLQIGESTLAGLDKEAQAFLGVPSILDVHRGATVVMSRGRASSWSATPQVSREFSNLGLIHVLVQAELTPKQIIVDLNLLPLSVRTKFRHFSQNEVIAAPGKIPAKIISVAIEPVLLDWIGPNQKSQRSDPALKDIAWVPRYGLVRRKDLTAARVVARYLEKT